MAKVDIRETREIEEIVDDVLETVKHLKKVIRKAIKPVTTDAKRRAPKGDPNKDPETPPLFTQIKTRIHEADHAIIGYVSTGSRHGHLVQLGHKVYRRGPKGDSARGKELKPLSGTDYVQGKLIIAPAIDANQAKVHKIGVAELGNLWAKATK